MEIDGIGKDVSNGYIDGRLERLDQCLTYYATLGYRVAELPITGLSVIINGKLFEPRVKRVKDIRACQAHVQRLGGNPAGPRK